MKRFLIIFLLIGNILYAQDTSGFNSTQRKSLRDSLGIRDLATTTLEAALLDSLVERDALISALSDSIALLTARMDTVGTSGMGSLLLGKFWIGNSSSVATQQSISGGDFSVDFTGKGTIGTGKVTNSMLAGNIDFTKMGTGIISNAEAATLNGINTTKTIQQQLDDAIDDFVVGTGVFMVSGDEIEGDSKTQDDVVFGLGDDNDMAMYYDSGNNQSVFLSTPKLQMGTISATDWEFYTNSVKRFSITSTGVIKPTTANATDLGSEAYPFRYAYLHDFVLHRPTSTPSFVDGRSYQGYGDAAGRWYSMYEDQESVEHVVYCPPLQEVMDSIDAKAITTNGIDLVTQVETDSVNFANVNTINKYITADPAGVTLYFKNYQSGISQQVVVYSQNDITISPPVGVTLLYQDQTELLYTLDGYYRIWFTYLSATKCLVDWGYYNEAP